MMDPIVSQNTRLAEVPLLVKEERFWEALVICNKYVDQFPTETSGYIARAQVFEARSKTIHGYDVQDHRMAAQDCKLAAQTSSDSFVKADLLSKASSLFHQAGEDELAVQAIEEAALADPENDEVFMKRMRLKIQQHKLEQLLADLDNGLIKNPNEIHLWERRGAILCSQHRYDEAAAAYEKVRNVEFYWSNPSLGLVYLWAKTYQASIEEFSRIIKVLEARNRVDPDDQDAHMLGCAYFYRSIAHLESGDRDSCLYDLDTSIHYEPNWPLSREYHAMQKLKTWIDPLSISEPLPKVDHRLFSHVSDEIAGDISASLMILRQQFEADPLQKENVYGDPLMHLHRRQVYIPYLNMLLCDAKYKCILASWKDVIQVCNLILNVLHDYPHLQVEKDFVLQLYLCRHLAHRMLHQRFKAFFDIREAFKVNRKVAEAFVHAADSYRSHARAS